jgi:lycopene beta-cyclase
MTHILFGKTTKRVLNMNRWRTKASTGYTFKIDKKSTQLVAFLQKGRNLQEFHKKTKFCFMTCFC